MKEKQIKENGTETAPCQNAKNKLQWHPAFVAGIQIEFGEEARHLTFTPEHLLGTKPMQIDILIKKILIRHYIKILAEYSGSIILLNINLLVTI